MRPFVALRLDDLGATSGEVGFAVAAFAALSLVLALPAGRLADRLPSTHVVFAAFLVQAGLSWGYATITSLAGIVLLQLGYGVAFLVGWLGLQAMIMSAPRGPALHFHLAVFSLGWGAGQAIGPSLGGVIYERLGFETLAMGIGVVLIIGCALVVALPVQARRVAEPERDAEGAAITPSITRDVRTLVGSSSVRLVLLAAFTVISVEAVRNSFYPILLVEEGYSGSQVGLLLTVAAAASLAIRSALPLIRRRYSAGAVLLGSTGAAVLGLGATPLLLFSVPLLSMGAVFMGLGNGLNPPITLELMASDVAARLRGSAAAVRAMSNRAANLVQPLAFSGLVTGVGMRASFPLASLGLGAFLGLMLRESRRRDVDRQPSASES